MAGSEFDRRDPDRKAEAHPINVYEEIVRLEVSRIMKELGSCQCETCYANACAIALNELRPKYVTTPKGAVLTEALASLVKNHADVTVEATKAVMKVMKNPRH